MQETYKELFDYYAEQLHKESRGALPKSKLYTNLEQYLEIFPPYKELVQEGIENFTGAKSILRGNDGKFDIVVRTKKRQVHTKK